MKTYTVDIYSTESYEFIDKQLQKLSTLFESDDFKNFLLEKCKKLLDSICQMNLPIAGELDETTNNYLSSMKTTITDDSIILYNDSVIDIDSKNMSETTKSRYPAQLSLAKIVEYGIGFSGSMSEPQSEVEDWAYDVNGHGVNGWYYKDDSGNLHWTDGFEGKFIFYKLSENIGLYISDWIGEYIDKKL